MYHFVCVDAFSRFKHARVYSSITSRSARRFFEEVEDVFPFQINGVITDNGSEYQGEFDQYLKTKNIPHFFTYPHTPKQNPYVERVIRTIIDEVYYFTGIEITLSYAASKACCI